MVDTWMCSAPPRIRNYWGPQCKALNFVHNPERSEDLIKRGKSSINKVREQSEHLILERKSKEKNQ